MENEPTSRQLDQTGDWLEKYFPEEGKETNVGIDELLESMNDPDRFLQNVCRDPRYKIIRDLAFDVPEGEIVPKSNYDSELRPYGKFEIKNDKKYVGGWQIDELGFYASSEATGYSLEEYERAKTIWITQNILGARRFGESDEAYEKRIDDLQARIIAFKESQEKEEK